MCEEMAQELEISVGSVHTILCNHLKMRKVLARWMPPRWMPHRLTSDQAERRLEVATHLLSRFGLEGQDFLSRIVATEEMWVRSYEPELKRQSAEWHTPISPRLAKYRRTQSQLKMLVIFAYDRHGILVTKPLMGNTMRSILKKTLRQAIRRVNFWQPAQ